MKQYEIVDRQTGKVVAETVTLSSALRAVDKRDNAYGGYRYFHRPKGSDRAQA
jgi:hypothetical protein